MLLQLQGNGVERSQGSLSLDGSKSMKIQIVSKEWRLQETNILKQFIFN